MSNDSISRDGIATAEAPAVQQRPDSYDTVLPQDLLVEALETFEPTASVYEIDPIADPRWAQLVASHPRASLFHDPRWLLALRTAYGYRPLAITTSRPGMPLSNGIVFCDIHSWISGRRLVSLPFSDHCEPLSSEAGDLGALLVRAGQEVDAGRYKRVEIRSVSYEPSAGTGLGKDHSYLLHRLDLRPSIEAIYRGFHKDCIQRKIRRADRENLQYEDGNSAELLGKFVKLMTMTRRRHGLPPQPMRWFRALISAFGKDLKIRIASKEGVAVASILTISHRRTVVYKYGCSDESLSRLGGTPFLFWRTIQEAKDNGQDQLDMGRSDTDGVGLIAFKEHWGARPSMLQYWNYPCRELSASSPWLRKACKKGAAVAPDWVLRAAGSLLYPHMG